MKSNVPLRQNIKDIKELRCRGYSLQDIGNKYNCTRERVRQVLLNPKPAKPLEYRKCIDCNVLFLTYIELQKFCHNCSFNIDRLKGYSRIRELVRIRDKRTCQKCNKKWIEGMRRFDVHHEDEEMEGLGLYKGIYKADKENMNHMITYCHKCHLNLDSVRSKMSGKRI